MQVRLKGLKIDTCLRTGNMLLVYNYPIKREFFNVFKAAEEMLKMNVIEIKKMVKGKEITRYYCYLIIYGNSVDVIPNFRKVQTELMLISRRAKSEVLKSDITNLEILKQYYETKTV